MHLPPYKSILEPLARRALVEPDARALILVHDDGRHQPLTVREFLVGAAGWRAALARLGLGPGDVVLLALGHSVALLNAFWGAMQLGALPAIYPLPSARMDAELYGRQVRELVRLADIRAIIVDPRFRASLNALLQGMNCQVIPSDAAGDSEPGDFLAPGEPARPDGPAFLQFSSGTTGAKKGVLIRHSAILDQSRALAGRLGMNRESVLVSWLPLHHDMGLVAGCLQALIWGIPTVLMSPGYWISRPQALLWAVHAYAGTHTWMPNFAFNHLLRVRPGDIEGVDLSSWRQILNGAEAIRYDSLQAFARRFAPYGLAETALTTGYGMAENTLSIALKPHDEPLHVAWVDRTDFQNAHIARSVPPGSDNALTLVSAGRPIPGTDLQIRGEAGYRMPDGYIGEIWIKGPSLFQGYYRDAAQTAAVFAGDWFKTGDLGFLDGDHLFVTGRKKDLIVVGGQNIYPEDIEHIANGTPGVYPGRAVAFGVPNARLGTETVVLLCETRGEPSAAARADLAATLRRRVVERLDVALADVRLFDTRWIIKSTSGKLARPVNRQKYLDLLAQEGGGGP